MLNVYSVKLSEYIQFKGKIKYNFKIEWVDVFGISSRTSISFSHSYMQLKKIVDKLQFRNTFINMFVYKKNNKSNKF